VPGPRVSPVNSVVMPKGALPGKPGNVVKGNLISHRRPGTYLPHEVGVACSRVAGLKRGIQTCQVRLNGDVRERFRLRPSRSLSTFTGRTAFTTVTGEDRDRVSFDHLDDRSGGQRNLPRGRMRVESSESP
jgi:hypothetical protein